MTKLAVSLLLVLVAWSMVAVPHVQGVRVVKAHAGRGSDEEVEQDEAGVPSLSDTPSSSSSSGSASASASGSQSASSSSSAADGPHDLMGDLVRNMLGAQDGAPSVFTGDGATMAVNNQNKVHREQEEEEDDKADEDSIKKKAEASMKRGMEERTKISVEERSKKMEHERKRSHAEHSNKRFQENLQIHDEEFKKKTAEEGTKEQEESTKRVEQAKKELDAAKDKAERERYLQGVKERASEETDKQKYEAAKKAAQEQIQKQDQHAAMTMQHEKEKELRLLEKTQLEEQGQKKMGELTEKKKGEEATKRTLAQQKEAQQRQAQQEEESEKAQRRDEKGKWCNCETVRTRFDLINQWHLCPAGKLMTGMYRGGGNTLEYLYYFYCCKPCRQDNTEEAVSDCVSANWESSFSNAGWSWCPDNTYIQGLYKEQCNTLNCIKGAYCCKIKGSRDKTECATKGSWGGDFDHEGWVVLDNEHFLTGLYRSGDGYLFNIEYPYQCKWFVH